MFGPAHLTRTRRFRSPFTVHRSPINKSEIRKQVLAQRDALDAGARAQLVPRITERLLQLDAWRDAQCVLAYVSFGSEFDTAAFIAGLIGGGKTLVLPKVDRENRVLKLYGVRDLERELAPGTWSIREPRADLCREVAPDDIEMVLVPGVAFTPRCERLGYGGGYYDGLINAFNQRPALVAAAFSLQIVPELPVTERDQKVDLVVTENAVYPRTVNGEP
ncbi:MAG: 5-formyltetrahydrofolate cyclo-ligase [Betaproteobacteria bacterium]|nr:5-formyltetrahydrofolate cyclo-ligase [Betaproteobacteria bacterium]